MREHVLFNNHAKEKNRVKTISTALAAVALLVSHGSLLAETPKVTVYKSPTCGCCSKWVDHMRENGFEVETRDMQNVNLVKSMSGVTSELASCHTALVDGYTIEGHVPAADVKRLLAERPRIKGLAAPGMPMGSPGMEIPGRGKDHFNVIAFDRDGTRTVFARH